MLEFNPRLSPDLFPTLDQPWYHYSGEKTLTLLGSDPEKGLTTAEVTLRQACYGLNELQEGAKRSQWQILLDQFSNVMLLMLIGVALVAGILDMVKLQGGHSGGDIPFKDTIAILAIVVLNGLLGYFQESRAEKALAALKRLASPQVQVLRDQQRLVINAEQLVPGDIMFLETGTQLAADGLLLAAANLQIREAALTGESHAVLKSPASQGLAADLPLGDRYNCVFAGTEVVQGRGKAIVVGTGMASELGKIAQMLKDVENEPTPLQKRMTNLGNILVSSSLALVFLVIAIGVGYHGWGMFQQLVETSLSMAVAVVPEGLPAVITVTLALGTQRMIQRQALIRKLPAVETLGSVNVICSDKTGTLTQNKMVVQAIATLAHRFRVTGEGYCPQGVIQTLQGQPLNPQDFRDLHLLLLSAVLCNNAQLQQNAGDWQILGDPTEGALLTVAGKIGLESLPLQSQYPRLQEFPFSAERKRMTVIVQNPGTFPTPAPYVLITKGSPEGILANCSQALLPTTSGESPAWQPIATLEEHLILTANEDLAGQGLRVLGLAYKPLSAISETEIQQEQDLIWLGLVGMWDAPRPEVQTAVAKCHQAGIRTVMITGDHPLTASVIATQLGISQKGERVLTGLELSQMNQAELEIQAETVSVFARVSPEHKLRIVQALQSRDRFVAMTGDGVNDAPALKQADIGVAMGLSGTDVSKEASDMVLLDDNFATIVAATEEGRVVYSNIRHFIKYILGSNIGEVITIAAAPLLGLPDVPLTPLQILWMNLVTDGLPALALAVEPGDPRVMSRPTYSPKESIFARGLGAYIIRIGLIFSMITITLMLWAYQTALKTSNPDSWKTMVFTTLCIAQMGHAIAVRSQDRLTIEMNPWSNPYLFGSVVATTLLQLLLIYVAPLREFFDTDLLTSHQLLICLGFSSLMFLWVELEKLTVRLWQPWRFTKIRSLGGQKKTP